MNNLIFWIIVCSWLIPLGIRIYNKSRARRLQDRNFSRPGYPPQGFPPPGYQQQQNYQPQNYPGYSPEPTHIRPADAAPPAGPPSNVSSTTFPSNSGSGHQGFRARKLAELDLKFSNGEIAMEDYMKQRGEIMNG
ncbi:hypothetical protein [Arthrobacter sp. StoSoilB5]|uniref:hypothetical protein n=1 Tax=Arthrobacter sp. StoSoilB5 TaxID=2830992 RepID=UPI001CC8177A|nr:hypothetical protein [Arthrobacter sp. StoSoilB5]BCW44266.1 hypothetical protein StoSoilB5_14500 [Arthrobacter sp. StoSoilB5]